MKGLKRILAIILAAGGAITVAGCASGPVYSSTSTMANWNVTTSATVEKNYTEFWRTHKEVATYSLSFTEGDNVSYKVEYDTIAATYTTSFYMDKVDYDWSAENLPEGVKISNAETAAPKDPVYVFESKLNVSGKYVLKANEESQEFDDEITTVCKYRLAGENLKPVYSLQNVKSTSPVALNAATKDGMCLTTQAVYETFYNRDCNKAVIKTTGSENTSEKSVDLSGLVFDNSQLRAALRSFSLNGVKSFAICSPQNGNVQQCLASCTTATELSTENDSQILNALKNVKDRDGYPVEDYIFFDGTSGNAETPEKQIRYHNVTLGVNTETEMKGSSPVYCYAALENANANATRCVLLKMITPLSFGLGTLTYNLKTLSLYTH